MTDDGEHPQGGPAPCDMPLERVEAELCTLAGQIAAATARFLRLLADFDARDGWAGWGVASCAHWLSWRCGLDLRTAREHVRVARSLSKLPAVSSTFAEGRISYSKARAISRVATAENEADLVHVALHNPAAHVERLVRGLLKAGASDEKPDAPAQRRPQVHWRWDDDGCLVIWGKLAAEDGSRVLAGLARMDEQRLRTEAADPAGADGPGAGAACGQDGSAEPRRRPNGSAEHAWTVSGSAPADLGPALAAAAELLCTEIQAPVFAPAADVVVHTDARTLVETASVPGGRMPNANAGHTTRVDDGPALVHSTLQRLACDGRLQLSVDGPDGRTVDLGRKRRRPNHAQLQALWRRDRGCTHPGCGRTRFLHAHHVVSWVCGGRTDLDNLVLLCGEHHRALHDGAFSVVALGTQRFRFHEPCGAVRPQTPATRGRAADLASAHGDIGPGTIEPDWDGSPLLLAEAVDVFRTGWRMRERRKAEVGSSAV